MGCENAGIFGFLSAFHLPICTPTVSVAFSWHLDFLCLHHDHVFGNPTFHFSTQAWNRGGNLWAFGHNEGLLG
jgi:hypothetical protein